MWVNSLPKIISRCFTPNFANTRQTYVCTNRLSTDKENKSFFAFFEWKSSVVKAPLYAKKVEGVKRLILFYADNPAMKVLLCINSNIAPEITKWYHTLSWQYVH